MFAVTFRKCVWIRPPLGLPHRGTLRGVISVHVRGTGMSIPCTGACHAHAPTQEQLLPSLQGDLGLAARALRFHLDKRVERDLSVSNTGPGSWCTRLAWARPTGVSLLSTRVPHTQDFLTEPTALQTPKLYSSLAPALQRRQPIRTPHPHRNTHVSPSNSGRRLRQKHHPYNIHCVSGRQEAAVPSPLTGTIVLK